jgi:peptide/nickel transport system permease protein
MPPDQYQALSEEQKEDARDALGLNDPAVIRYFRWLNNILHGDFGYSSSTGQNIGAMLAGRLPYTIELAFYGLMLATIIGLVLGFLSAVLKNTVVDHLCTTVSVLGISLPEFFFGIVFIVLFSVKLKWFPSGGRMSVGDPSFWGRIPYMVLPVMTMAIALTAALVRYVKSSMLDVLGKDYIKTARSKGLNETTVNLKHAFRNSLIPTMTLIVMRLPRLVGGSVVIETVFNYPGIGDMAMTALSASDIPVVMITTMTTGVMVLISSTLVDIVTAMLDPRIRLG